MPLYRGIRQNVYHHCGICGTRQKLDDMVWQNGVLRCSANRCVSKAIVGSRDINVAREIAIDRHELEPHDKLVNPVDRKNDMNDVLY